MPVTHWQHQSDARAALVKGFIASYKEVTGVENSFESIPYGDYFTKLGAALEANNGPCVFQLPANILAEYQKRGELAPVPDDVMTSADIESTFSPASTRLLKFDGKYYGLPTDVQTMLLFYNDDLFRAAGLDPTKDFATWDEFREAAIKLTKSDGGQMSQAGLDITGSPYQWYYSAPTLAYQDGLVNDSTLAINYASEPGYQVWDRLTSLVTKDKVDSPQFLADQPKFASGLAGMTLREYTFSGVFKQTAPDLKYSVHLPPPVADKQFAAAATTSWSYAVGSDCKDQPSAWAWVRYLTSEASQRIWITGGGELPSRTAVLNDATLSADPGVAVGFKSLADAMPYDSLGWDDVFSVQQKIWDSIVLDGMDVKSAVDAGAKGEADLYKQKGVTN
ncbi:MAG: extracellular solute-binding protein [Chloroflexi bacterium]|nr:extracellular solute-binding protein [Chloroflexota bacterium]